MIQKLSKQSELSDRDRQIPSIITEQEKPYQTDNLKNAPPTAKDLYEVKSELSYLKAIVTEVLGGTEYVRSGWSRKVKTAQPFHGHVRRLPMPLSYLYETIEKSREIVNRPKDTIDEMGGVCAQETWQRAVDILTAHARKVWLYARVKIRCPIITPGPKGSVDLYWPPCPYGLLLNVPADIEGPITYYGDDAENLDSNATSGKIEPIKEIDAGVLAWLAHMEEKQSGAGR